MFFTQCFMPPLGASINFRGARAVTRSTAWKSPELESVSSNLLISIKGSWNKEQIRGVGKKRLKTIAVNRLAISKYSNRAWGVKMLEGRKFSELQFLQPKVSHQHLCFFGRGRWGTVDTFLHFQPLLLYFKSKQTQNLSQKKAILYTQYYAKTWKQRPSENIGQTVLKGYFFCRVCPSYGAHSTWAWDKPDKSKKLVCMHCIMFMWYPM